MRWKLARRKPCVNQIQDALLIVPLKHQFNCIPEAPARRQTFVLSKSAKICIYDAHSALASLIITADSNAITLDSNAIRQNSNAISRDSIAIKRDSNAISHDSKGIRRDSIGVSSDSNAITPDDKGISLDCVPVKPDSNAISAASDAITPVSNRSARARAASLAPLNHLSTGEPAQTPHGD